MRVFMLGWEFPPFISGGLGTACYGLTKGLDEIGVEVCFVLPTPVPVDDKGSLQFRTPADVTSPAPDGPGGQVDLKTASTEEIVRLFKNVELHRIPGLLQAYASPETYRQAIEEFRRLQQTGQATGQGDAGDAPAWQPQTPQGDFQPIGDTMYSGDLLEEVRRYETVAVALARQEEFDVVHAHDWMTFPAGLAVAKATGKPLIVQIHSTEFDRSGEDINQLVYDIERAGMHGADRVVCVSYLTSRIATSRYGVDAGKISVVYNAVELPDQSELQLDPITSKEKIVLFLGRVTMQKGPEYFLQAAKKVVAKYKNVRFIIAGSGDMITQCIHQAARLRLGKYVTFTGFLRGKDVDQIFAMADLFVMPSVSEPFGIAPLEALSHDVPVIISKQSGVSEVLTHVLKVDFWDIDEMANKILAVLRHPPLQRALSRHGRIDLAQLSWTDSARTLADVYYNVLAK